MYDPTLAPARAADRGINRSNRYNRKHQRQNHGNDFLFVHNHNEPPKNIWSL
jgi:hypothetical protein